MDSISKKHCGKAVAVSKGQEIIEKSFSDQCTWFLFISMSPCDQRRQIMMVDVVYFDLLAGVRFSGGFVLFYYLWM